MPALVCASLLFLGWSFYNIYGRGMGTRATKIISWLSLTFIVVFWSWHLFGGGWSSNGQ